MEVARIVAQLAQTVEAAGAQVLIMTANAIHMVADEVAQAIHIPLIHIADPTGSAIRRAGLKKVGLLGTKVTMEKPFYQARLQNKFGIESIVPDNLERDQIHKIIFDELVQGKVVESFKRKFLHIIDNLIKKGAQAIILGCTEFNLLVQQQDTPIPLFDTTTLHAKAAVDFALG